MHFGNSVALAAVLFTFEILFFCRGWIVLNLFLNFKQKRATCSYKIVLKKSVVHKQHVCYIFIVKTVNLLSGPDLGRPEPQPF